MNDPEHSRSRQPKLLFFITEDYYFLSHRLPLAIAARDRGYDVVIVSRENRHGPLIRRHGFRLIPFDSARSGINPLTDIPRIIRLTSIYRRERPDIVHHVAMKPVLYGSVAARLSGCGAIVNALTGMGWLFTSRTGLAAWLKPFVQRALGRAARQGIALVQNEDDAALLRQLGVDDARIRVVAGSGVDVQRFRPTPIPCGTPVVVMHARLLWDKGVGEFVEAARMLRARGVTARFLLAGETDAQNPARIASAQIDAWKRDGAVEFLGQVDDIPALLAQSTIVCLPSHREGLPKSLIEAAAAGRPIVTTDVPGCRAVVRHGDNGLLVAVRDAKALADALATLLADPELCKAMGARGRERAEREFATDIVINHTLAVYREVRS